MGVCFVFKFANIFWHFSVTGSVSIVVSLIVMLLKCIYSSKDQPSKGIRIVQGICIVILAIWFFCLEFQ